MKKADDSLKRLTQEITEAESHSVEEFSLTRYASLDAPKTTLREATQAARNGTYYGYLNSASLCGRAKEELRNAFVMFRDTASADAQSKISKLRQYISELSSRIPAIRDSDMSGAWIALMIVGSVISMLVGFRQCSDVYEANTRQEIVFNNWIDNIRNDLKAKGVDPTTLSRADLQNRGYRMDDMPSRDIGQTSVGTWLFYAFFGTIASVAIGIMGNAARRKAAIAELRSTIARSQLEVERIQQVDSRFHKPFGEREKAEDI